MAEQKSSVLTAPLHGAASVLRKVPGAGMVSRAAEGTLDKVGAVSPRGRRIAVYAGAGVLGAVGAVEWPVALTGAAVAWLTQPRPAHPAEQESGAGPGSEPAHDLGTAALRSGHGAGSRTAGGSGGAASAEAGGTPGGTDAAVSGGGGTDAAGSTGASSGGGAAAGDRTSGGGRTHGSSRSTGGARTSRGAEGSAVKPSPGPLGPTARPDRTTL
ncbi:hypothetical protein [Streptomyces sp. NPDC001135]